MVFDDVVDVVAAQTYNRQTAKGRRTWDDYNDLKVIHQKRTQGLYRSADVTARDDWSFNVVMDQRMLLSEYHRRS